MKSIREYINLVEEILLENNLQVVVQRLGPKLVQAYQKDSGLKPIDIKDPMGVATALSQGDPTPTQKCLMWIAKCYIQGDFKLEDLKRVKEEIEFFQKNKNRIANKDLLSYKSFFDMIAVIGPLKKVEPASSRNAKDEQILKDGTEKLIWTPTFRVFKLKTVEAAEVFGKKYNVKWCTSDEEAFCDYTDKGDLIVVMAWDPTDSVKPRGDIGPGHWRKYQIHWEDKQIKNSLDREASQKEIDFLDSHDEWAQFLELMIEKHITPTFSK